MPNPISAMDRNRSLLRMTLNLLHQDQWLPRSYDDDQKRGALYRQATQYLKENPSLHLMHLTEADIRQWLTPRHHLSIDPYQQLIAWHTEKLQRAWYPSPSFNHSTYNSDRDLEVAIARSLADQSQPSRGKGSLKKPRLEQKKQTKF